MARKKGGIEMKETGLRLPMPLYEELLKMAAKEHRSLNSQIVTVLEQAMKISEPASE
jgi:hypothetical protein